MGCTLCTDLDLVINDIPDIQNVKVETAPLAPLQMEQDMIDAKKRIISLKAKLNNKRTSEKKRLTNTI